MGVPPKHVEPDRPRKSGAAQPRPARRARSPRMSPLSRRTLADVPVSGERPSYVYESWAVVLVVCYLVNYFVGRAKNDRIAKAW